MDDWGRARYGDPCRACGFDWSVGPGAAVDMVAAAPGAFQELLSGATGTERHPALSWTVTGYTCHVADNLRIWAERLAGVADGDPASVAPYDPDALAAARGYEHAGLAGALWSLGRAAADWASAMAAAEAAGVVLVHPERGELDTGDVARANAHDAGHHLVDVRRSLHL